MSWLLSHTLGQTCSSSGPYVAVDGGDDDICCAWLILEPWSEQIAERYPVPVSILVENVDAMTEVPPSLSIVVDVNPEYD